MPECVRRSTEQGWGDSRKPAWRGLDNKPNEPTMIFCPCTSIEVYINIYLRRTKLIVTRYSGLFCLEAQHDPDDRTGQVKTRKD